MLPVVVLAGLGWAGAELRAYARTSPRFALTEVEVLGAERANPELLREQVGLPIGVNVFDIDLRAVEARARGIGWVRSARAERVLPSRVRIRIEEHRPEALVAFGELYYVSRDGEVFRAYGAGEPVDLPIVTGVDREGFERASPDALARLETALTFLDAWREAFGELGGLPREVEALPAGLVRFVDDAGRSVWIGPAPWGAALDRVREMLGEPEVAGCPSCALYVGRGPGADRVVLSGPHAGVGAGRRDIGGATRRDMGGGATRRDMGGGATRLDMGGGATRLEGNGR